LRFETAVSLDHSEVHSFAHINQQSPQERGGTVKIVAPSAGHRSSYDWQSSPDGKTWTDLGTTLQAKTTLTGQTAGTVLQFRYRAVVKAGAGDWSTPVTITVK
jgi:hypothetical protein